ncbi:2635_t:CDS:1 [Cetraspora pellucida]|uniref:2635_t:CDS:1 n=1 Tax=Cetraspora pellucida TaxID=1433469 RepID=A0A9N8W0L2_9GLOM|nr:2635_t:CDS:1 [Cetraspora pellucida]
MSDSNVLMILEGFYVWRIISMSTYNDTTIQIVQNNLGDYFIKVEIRHEIRRHETNSVPFSVPNENDVINLQRGSTVPPNCFLIFRRQVQSAIRTMDMRIARGTLSRLLGNIWRDLSSSDPNLLNSFRTVANNVARIYNEMLRIRIFNGPRI